MCHRFISFQLVLSTSSFVSWVYATSIQHSTTCQVPGLQQTAEDSKQQPPAALEDTGVSRL